MAHDNSPKIHTTAIIGSTILGLIAIIALGIMVFLTASCGRTYLLQAPTPPIIDTMPSVGFGDDTNQPAVDSALMAIDAPELPTTPPSDTFTFRLQFQMAGIGPLVWEEVVADIDTSIAKANRYFRGYIKFVRDEFIYDYDLEQRNIYTLYDDFAQDRGAYNSWVNTRAATEEEGVITVFLMPTFPRGNSMLLGFCPVLTSGFDWYERYYTDPRMSDIEAEDLENNFEHLFISYEGAHRGNTLAHELGHWLGLAHVWELDALTMQRQGLTLASTQARNLMNYVERPEELTDGQLQTAWQMAGTFRSYLLQ